MVVPAGISDLTGVFWIGKGRRNDQEQPSGQSGRAMFPNVNSKLALLTLHHIS